MDIIISTISRPANQYLFQTLTSLYVSQFSEPISLYIGNMDETYLSCIRHHNNIKVVSMSQEEWSNIKDCSLDIKFNYNFYRCLISNLDEDLLYLEDDVTFKDNWFEECQKVVNYLKLDYSQFALSLYTPYTLDEKELLTDFKEGFYGTQAVFFTKEVRKLFSLYVKQEGVEDYKHMADILLQKFCQDNITPLFVLNNPLVQHIGEISSIHLNPFHTALNF